MEADAVSLVLIICKRTTVPGTACSLSVPRFGQAKGKYAAKALGEADLVVKDEAKRHLGELSFRQ